MSMDLTSLPVERGPGAGAVVLPVDDQLIEVDDLPVAVGHLLWHLSSEPAPAAAGAQRCAR